MKFVQGWKAFGLFLELNILNPHFKRNVLIVDELTTDLFDGGEHCYATYFSYVLTQTKDATVINTVVSISVLKKVRCELCVSSKWKLCPI